MGSSLGNKEIMAKNIIRYMDKYEKDRKQVCRDLKISYTTFTDWVKARTYPRIDKIELLANYFGVTKADLVEDHSDGTVNEEICDLFKQCYGKDAYMAVQLFLRLDQNDRAVVVTMIKSLLSGEKYHNEEAKGDVGITA